MGLLAHHTCIDFLALPLDERPDRARPAKYPGPRCYTDWKAYERAGGGFDSGQNAPDVTRR